LPPPLPPISAERGLLVVSLVGLILACAREGCSEAGFFLRIEAGLAIITIKEWNFRALEKTLLEARKECYVGEDFFARGGNQKGDAWKCERLCGQRCSDASIASGRPGLGIRCGHTLQVKHRSVGATIWRTLNQKRSEAKRKKN